ncbi:cob(I)yrinic acid a,c-diamide adenosyltransferase [Candidatus Peregrinibacteria bacterium CG22_combo_CG10-13_8_21_14_all_44_10]|nr:MAG: hypothetical protein AUK45_05300 [Candidatus Peregrinibacteria bacterium CG2_30_44_17]PIP65980.1 MAG: cob(I)yrinic acid a,c-diamide adenosyltransferase [Candidatus Peregrinibacteria bacterium CG22_combo_CG10-13_8_21_14_all_44_10]PIX79471.1 MAG: cob(I)yrinic acid a,c-diamide adenosyltransferase [Candidatus Peregrinibacteria bacterium CG_4_10_14_3_um_filter_44_21]PJB88692.1 MAG: cob(I)yrinic acid a,c-diamide adenosyltransferase [Candidatus Peregrinibacteria bacterium CG_4_9_14_0_8_um_filte
MRQILVLTGNGKGKTTSAFGTAIRALGHNRRVLIIQFMKELPTGELTFLSKLRDPNLRTHQAGVGFHKIRGEHATEDEHKATMQKGLNLLENELVNHSPNLVVLDEVNVACELKLLDSQKILEIIEKNPKISFILTGRDAPQEFIEIADLITDMQEVRHPFQSGKLAQEGIDF